MRSPGQLAEIAQNSQLDYTIDIATEQLPRADEEKAARESVLRSRNYQIPEGNGYKIGQYELDSVSNTLFALAESAYSRKDYVTAENHYLEILVRQPDLAFIMTMVGECKALSGQEDAAMLWWQKAVEENFFDYLPHWFLADRYNQQGKKDLAVSEIALAWVLNRNHAKLRAAALEIFERAKVPAIDFDFQPNYLIEKKGARVAILCGEEWTSYGLCKALWAHEPGFASVGSYNMAEEQECLMGLLAVWEVEGKKALKKGREYIVLNRAVEEHFLAEFIFFELWLPREPYIVLTQPREGLMAIAEYVTAVRGLKK
jgi:tetratricopeptide (TPR) repeat protein